MTPAQEQVALVQRRIRHAAKALRIPGLDIAVDGQKGPETEAAIELVKEAIGYKPRYATAAIDDALLRRLAHPLRAATPAQIARGLRRRRQLRAAARKTLGERAWDAAGRLLWVREHGGNNTGPMVDKIIRSEGGQIGEPWCGDFADYCYRLAGSILARSQRWAYVFGILGLPGIRRTTAPQAGDLAVYAFGHVGLFGHWIGGGSFVAREGNTGDMGAISDSAGGGDGVKEKVRHRSQVRYFLRVTR